MSTSTEDGARKYKTLAANTALVIGFNIALLAVFRLGITRRRGGRAACTLARREKTAMAGAYRKYFARAFQANARLQHTARPLPSFFLKIRKKLLTMGNYYDIILISGGDKL